jgi:hypothetical protein
VPEPDTVGLELGALEIVLLMERGKEIEGLLEVSASVLLKQARIKAS